MFTVLHFGGEGVCPMRKGEGFTLIELRGLQLEGRTIAIDAMSQESILRCKNS